MLETLTPLAGLSPEAMAELATVLEKGLSSRLVVDPDVERLVRDCPSLSNLDGTQRAAIAEAVTGFHFLKASAGESAPALIEQVIDAYKASLQSKAGAVDLQSIENLQAHLTRILEITPLRASVKALDLLGVDTKVFLRSRIVSDLRPVFDDELSQPLLGSIVLHTLVLSFRADGQTRTINICMDDLDLSELQAVVERALAKTAHIKSIVSSNGVVGPLIDLEGNDE